MSILFWPSVFLVLGLLLLIVEVFIPSGGFIGICSIFCLVLCLWYAFAQSLGLGVTFMVVDLVALPLTAGLAFSLWSRTPLGRRFFLKPPAPEEIEVSHADHHLESLVGQVGRTLTPFATMRSRRDRRPAGRRPRRGGLLAGVRTGSRAAGPVRSGRGAGNKRSRAEPPGSADRE